MAGILPFLYFPYFFPQADSVVNTHLLGYIIKVVALDAHTQKNTIYRPREKENNYIGKE